MEVETRRRDDSCLMSGGELTHKFSSFFLRRRGRRTCEHHYSPISDTSSWLHGLVLIELRACWRIVTEHSRSKAVVNFWWGLAQTKTFRRGRHVSFRPIKLVVRGMKPATAHLCSVFFLFPAAFLACAGFGPSLPSAVWTLGPGLRM